MLSVPVCPAGSFFTAGDKGSKMQQMIDVSSDRYEKMIVCSPGHLPGDNLKGSQQHAAMILVSMII